MWWWWWWWEAPGPVSVLESQFLHESGITPKSVILPRLISGFLFPRPRNILGRTSILVMGGYDFTAFSKKVQGTNSKEVLSLLELKKLRNSQANFQNRQTFCVSFLVVESVILFIIQNFKIWFLSVRNVQNLSKSLMKNWKTT
jgi:hypothetical protein